jgi:FSR family fosmidomycin resistance protein-like MFS transporter
MPLAQKTLYSVLFSIAFAHLINDLMQSVIPAAYPILKNFSLNFTQIGLITFVYQLTASLLQPFIGFYTDKKPKPYSLAIGMVFTISGLALLIATQFWMILVAVSLVGIGSSIFHPASRVAFLGSGGRGLAQSIFQLAVTLEVLGTVAGCYNCGTFNRISSGLCARGYFRNIRD